jgi:hypothetical protein
MLKMATRRAVELATHVHGVAQLRGRDIAETATLVPLLVVAEEAAGQAEAAEFLYPPRISLAQRFSS